MSQSEIVPVSGKTGMPLSSITTGFKYQSLPNSCYTTGIYNILHDLCIRHAIPGLGLPESRVNKICNYRDVLGPKLDSIVPNLNHALLQMSYTSFEKSRRKYDDLANTTKNPWSSYPLVSLSFSYLLKEQLVNEKALYGDPDHVVIVLSCDQSSVFFFDPYEGFIRRPRTKNSIGRGVASLSTPKFLQYWDSASDPSWIFWIERNNKSQRNLLSFIQEGDTK
ncbi:MAG: hypothetical protein ACYC7D_15920 [Nitrososphaerales archaeon]